MQGYNFPTRFQHLIDSYLNKKIQDTDVIIALLNILYSEATTNDWVDRLIGEMSLRKRQDEMVYQFIKYALNSNDKAIIVDVGASDGWFIDRVRKVSQDCTIISYEPSVIEFEKLKKKWGSDPHIKLINAGLGRKKCYKILNIIKGNHGLSSFLNISKQYKYFSNEFDQTIERQDLATILKFNEEYFSVAEYKASKDLFIKIDVQGMELDVLLGGKSIIKNFTKGILIELMVDKKYNDAPTYKDVCKYLLKFGFEPYDIHPFYREDENHFFTTKNYGRVTEYDVFFVKT